MQKKYFVYLHLNKTNGKRYYGITAEKTPEIRWKKGYSHNPHFSAAIAKYGWEGFDHIIVASNLTKKQAEQKEVELIKKYNSNNQEFGYNLTCGGGVGVFKHSEESKRLMSEHTKGELNPMYGKHHTEETKKKISNNLKNHIKTSKRVLCLETGKVYPSSREIERKLNINHNCINAACNGKQKTAGGKHWQYIDEETYISILKQKEGEK